MSAAYYIGTSAYKMEQYNSYTEKMQEKQEEKKRVKTMAKKLTRKKLILAFSAAVLVATAFLYLNVVLLQTSASYTSKVAQLEDLKMRNAQLSFDVASGVDLAVVEAKAKNEYGMQRPESHQNVYVKVCQNEYAETFTAPRTDAGFVERMITSLKAFLAYIG